MNRQFSKGEMQLIILFVIFMLYKVAANSELANTESCSKRKYRAKSLQASGHISTLPYITLLYVCFYLKTTYLICISYK